MEMKNIDASFDIRKSEDIAECLLSYSSYLESQMGSIANAYLTPSADILNDDLLKVYEVYRKPSLKRSLMDVVELGRTYNMLNMMTEKEVVDGYLNERVREYLDCSSPKLTKALVRVEGEQSEAVKLYTTLVSDFRSGQAKKDKGFLVLSGLPHHKIGASYYGHQWSSCQDVNGEYNHENYVLHVGGLLSEDSIIAFTDFSGRPINEVLENPSYYARSIVRYAPYRKNYLYFYSKTYGTTEFHKQILRDCLEECGVHSGIAVEDWKEDVIQLEIEQDPFKTRGGECTACDSEGELNIYFFDSVYHTVDCVMCDGDGEYTTEEGLEIDCPACEGTGTREIKDEIDIDAYIECPICEGTKVDPDESMTMLAYEEDDRSDQYFRYSVGYDATYIRISRKKASINLIEQAYKSYHVDLNLTPTVDSLHASLSLLSYVHREKEGDKVKVEIDDNIFYLVLDGESVELMEEDCNGNLQIAI